MGGNSLLKRLKFYHCLLIFFFTGCVSEEVSEVIDKNGYFYISPKPAFISDSSVIDWNVGPLGRVSLSKGLLFKINLPHIPEEHLRNLINEYNIDSWIVNIRKKASGSIKSMQYFYIPIVNEASVLIKGSSSYRLSQKKSFITRVYYVDAAMSERFENFSCPALGHNLVLKDAALLKRKSFNRFIVVQSKGGVPFKRKVVKYQVSGNKVNGGKSLIGEYSAEIALYNSKNKRLFSNFYDLQNVIKATVERAKSIKGCTNFKIPKKSQDSDFSLKFLNN